MQTGGPSCPLHLGTLDSPDYWTDDALMAAVRPLSATELHRMALGMQHRQERRDQFDPARSGSCRLFGGLQRLGIKTQYQQAPDDLSHVDYHERTRLKMMTRFVMRNGDVFESSRDPRHFDAYCYRKDGVEETCIMLSDQSEIQFLMQMGNDAHLKYDAVELG